MIYYKEGPETPTESATRELEAIITGLDFTNKTSEGTFDGAKEQYAEYVRLLIEEFDRTADGIPDSDTGKKLFEEKLQELKTNYHIIFGDE